MKTIFKRLLRDKVSLGIWLLTIGAAVGQVAPFLYILILFIFRGIMWEGQYYEALDKYVTDPKNRAILGLDENKKAGPIEVVFQIVTILGVIGAAIYLMFR